MANAQLGSSERTMVIQDADTDRVLGFCPEFAKPMIPKGARVKTTVLNHAIEIEKWCKRFRAEAAQDREEKTYRQVLREAPTRKAIRDALIERSNHLNPMNRDLNYAMLAIMDQRYRQVLADKEKVESFMLAEKYEAGVNPEDLAMQNPVMAGKIQ